MNRSTPTEASVPLTLNVVDASAVLRAIAELAEELECLRHDLATWQTRDRLPSLVTTNEVAQHLRVCRRTVARWVSDGLLPRAVRIQRNGSSHRLWKRADIESWIAQHGE